VPWPFWEQKKSELLTLVARVPCTHREGLTPDGDFIISPHPACRDLFIATCGSFHGFKFFPVLGKYVVEMLDGLLDPTMRQRWAWDRDASSVPGTTDNCGVPFRDLHEFAM